MKAEALYFVEILSVIPKLYSPFKGSILFFKGGGVKMFCKFRRNSSRDFAFANDLSKVSILFHQTFSISK